MKKLYIEATEKTPEINFDNEVGLLKIKGKAIPEDPNIFYEEPQNWIIEYTKNPAQRTTLELSLEYFNTSSSKIILDILNRVDALHREGKSEVSVKWFFESDDPDMEDAGNDYKHMVKAPFELIPVDEFDFDF